jgi:hypothetical protein
MKPYTAMGPFIVLLATKSIELPSPSIGPSSLTHPTQKIKREFNHIQSNHILAPLLEVKLNFPTFNLDYCTGLSSILTQHVHPPPLSPPLNHNLKVAVTL